MPLTEVNWNPSSRELRQFAGIWFPAFCALVGALLLRSSGSLLIPTAIWGVAIAIGLVGFFRPSFIRPVYVAWMGAAYPVGWTISHLLLAVVFFAVLTPLGLVMRLFGYDPMAHTFDRSATTYWTAHNPGADSSRYFRQV